MTDLTDLYAGPFTVCEDEQELLLRLERIDISASLVSIEHRLDELNADIYGIEKSVADAERIRACDKRRKLLDRARIIDRKLLRMMSFPEAMLIEDD